MPRQIYCTGCTERTFYVMAQDDGSIEIFCAKNNHRQLIVDIPTLVEVIYNGKAESSSSEPGGSGQATRDTEAEEVQTPTEIKPALVLDGPLGRLDD